MREKAPRLYYIAFTLFVNLETASLYLRKCRILLLYSVSLRKADQRRPACVANVGVDYANLDTISSDITFNTPFNWYFTANKFLSSNLLARERIPSSRGKGYLAV